MTALQEAAMRKALEALETCSYGDYSAKHVVDPSFDGDAVEAAIESLKAALAQHGEQAKPAAYITPTEQGPMVWTPEMYDEACTYCDDGEFPVPLYTAAPAPQAQPDWLLKTTQDLANSIRRRCFPEVPQFQVLDDLAGVISQIDNMTCGMERKSAPQAQEPCPNGSKCKHGAWCTEVYCQELCEFRNQPAPQPAQGVPETNFGNMPKIGCVQHDCGECKARAAQPVAPLTDDEILTIAHRKATRYTHAVAPGQVTYGFSVAHLLDFAHGIREVK